MAGEEEARIRSLEKEMWESASLKQGKEPPPVWPFVLWDRYRFLGFIGRGAMGQVFRVYDSLLHRDVAMKVLAGGSLKLDFLAEARAQAAVDHPYVVKVHEMGEEEGFPYIVMQWVQGLSLLAARGEFGLEERVEILRQACQGVQAAHAKSLLHRDIKPANIVVEKDPDGRLHAYVVDFGMAVAGAVSRPGAGEGMAQAGSDSSITGTPAFMSPEQAAGESLDARSDVFSLGATLYFALTGELPFSGRSDLSIMGSVALRHPESPRKFNTSVPADLEAIVHMAMEKSPDLRYPSAEAMGRDLQRWLEGSPVAAMKKNRFYRSARWLRRNKMLSAALVLLILVSTIVIVWGIYIHQYAAKQTHFYQYFGQEAERMEAALALAEGMPLHDTSPEREGIRQKMLELQGVMAQGGHAAQAPGYYALGRGHMVLEQWGKARQALERAWRLGHRMPETAFVLGHCLSQIYMEELNKFEGSFRLERKEELDRTLKPLIVDYLVKARQCPRGEMVAFAEALLAMAEEQYEKALKKVDHVLKLQPWNVEAVLLKAKICLAVNKAGSSLTALKEGKILLTRASEMARSCVRVYESESLTALDEMLLAIHQRRPFLHFMADLRTSAEKARLAHGGSWKSFQHEAEALFFSRDVTAQWYWEQKGISMGDPGTMRRVIELSEKALSRSPEDIRSLNTLGMAQWKLALLHNCGRGVEAESMLQKAEAAFHRALLLAPHAFFILGNLGNVLNMKGQLEMAQGKVPLASLYGALDYLNRAETVKRDPMINYTRVWVYLNLAHYRRWQALPMREMLQKSANCFYAYLRLHSDRPEIVAFLNIYMAMVDDSLWRGAWDEEAAQLMQHHIERVLREGHRQAALTWQARLDLMRSFAGKGKTDLGRIRRALDDELKADPLNSEVRYWRLFLELEIFRRSPSWKRFLVLERHVDAQSAELMYDWLVPHFLAFEACRVGMTRKSPGATPEQWHRRMVESMDKAKRTNPLLVPLVDQTLRLAEEALRKVS